MNEGNERQTCGVPTVADMLATLKGHEWRRRCPACEADCGRVAMVDLVYTFAECQCDAAPYTHLVETLHHRACFLTAALAQKEEE